VTVSNWLLRSGHSRLSVDSVPTSDEQLQRLSRIFLIVAAKSKAFTMTNHRLGPIARSSVVTFFAAITALLAVSISSGAPPKLPLQAATDSISIEPRFVDAKGDPVAIEDRPGDVSLALGAIAGSIGGIPDRTLQVVRISKLSAIEINLGTFEAAVGQQAVTMTAAAAASGLRIDPVDTRFARASTLLNHSGALRGPLVVEFADKDSKNVLILMYFDRPCHLTGTKEIADRTRGGEKPTLVYDVIVEKPGLSWLVRTAEGASGFRMHAADEPVRPILVVAPVQNMRHGAVQIN
jgi:hypothetical protein